MSDLIITPGSGKIDFIYQSGQEGQTSRLESIIIDPDGVLVFSGKISASSVTSPINVTATSSNLSYPFIFASSGETGPKSLLIDSAGGTYNPSTNTATIDVSGNLTGTATTASYANALNPANSYTVVGITGALTGTATTASYANALNAANSYTVVGITGALTGTSSWATNALTATNATQLNGQAASYYTNIPARLGYTPVNQAGDTVAGNLTVNGNFSVNGSFTAFSASNVYISSSQLYIEDNILTLNAFSPYLRYAGIEMYDSGSGTLSNLLWDGEGDYFFLSGSSVNGKIITGPDSQANLSSNFVPKATAGYKLGNSLIYDDGTNVGIGTTIPAGGFHINNSQGNFSEVLRLQRSGGIFYSVGLDTNFLNIAYNGNTNASNIFVLKQNGFLGLGNLQTANYNLDIASTQAQGIQLRFDTSTNYLARITPYWNSNTDTRIDFAINRSSGATPDVIMSVGYGGNVGVGTTSPAAKLHVNSTTAGATLLRTDGTNGTLFSVVDDLSDSLMSVNNSAGLPVLEVFADDRIVMGQYGQNDFVLVNNKVGIGTNNPANKLTVSGSVSIGESYINTTAPSNGLAVQGNVGIGTTSPGAKLEVKGIDDASITAIFQSTAGGNVAYNGGIQLGNAASSQNSKIYHNSSGDNTLTFESNYSSGTANKFIFSPGGTERVRFQQNGKVGIGTTVPTSSLHIKPLALGADLLILERYATQAKLIYAYESAADGYLEVRSGADVIISKLSGYASTPSYFQSNVGIGTTNPVAKLQVNGNVSGSSFTSSISNAVGFLGTSSWATNATNALQLGGTVAADYVTLLGTQTLANKTITGTFTGALTGTATTASYANALNAANNYTVGTITGNLTGTATTASYANNLNAANNYTVGTITGALTGTSSWASNATNALQLNGVAAASYVTLTGTQNLTNKTLTSPTLVTPVLGTPSSGDLTSCTFPTLNQSTTGTAATASYANALNPANKYTVVGITGSLFGTSSWASNAVTSLVCTGNSATATIATTASYANNLNAANNYTVGTITGALTGTATTASYANALNAANSYTVTNLTATNEIGTRSTNIGANLERGDATVTTLRFDSDNFRFYSGGTGALGEILRITEGGLVGIGTSSPSYKLEVYSGAKTSAFTGLSISNFNNYDGTAASLVTSQLRFAILENDTGTYNAPARTFAILESGNEANNSSSDGFFAISTRFNGSVAQKFRITAAGNVGIGTSSPLKLFHVHGNSGELIRLSMTSSYTASNGPQLSFWNATSEELASIRGVFNENNQGNRANLIFGTRTSDTLGVESKMTILHNGNVGIGTTGPGTKLEVSGSIRGGFFPVLVTNTGEAWFGRGGDRTLGTYTLQLGGSSATGTKFEIVDRDWTKVIASISGEAPLDSFLINTSGNLGIGTGSPVAKLQVNGNVSGSSFTSSISNAVGFLGTSSWATNATNALQLGGTVASSYVTLADTQSLTNKTITGTFTGALTGTATTASYANALNVANSYTVTNLTASGVGKFFGNIAIITDASAGDYSLIGHSYGGVTKAFTGYNGGSAVYGGESTIPTRIQAGGQYVISVLANGNVGIGTTSPLSKLHISGSGQTIMRLDSDTTTNVSQFQIKAASDAVIIMGMFGGSATGNNYGVTAAGQAYFGTSTLGSPHPTSLVIGNASNIPIVFSTNNVERMRIDGAGLVGIGTTVPSTLLHAYGSDGRYFTFSGTSGLFTIQRNVITTGGANPVLSLINTQGMDASGVVGRGTAIQLDLGYGGSSSAVGTAARGARIAALGETLYDATAANQNASLVFYTSTAGTLTEKMRITSGGNVGIGTTAPSASLHVNSTTAGATLLRTDGTNGTLFSVVDDLSDSLMSVNNSAGLPVLEVFADDRIVAGQYGQNDLVVINNKVGIGTNNPVAKLQVTSSTSIPSAIFMGGNVGIGTTSPSSKLHVYDNGGSFRTDLDSTYHMGMLNEYVSTYVSRTKFGRWNSTSNLELYYDIAGTEEARITRNFAAAVLKFNRGVNIDMIIDGNGNVGIGTTLPTTPLHVVGVISGSSFSGAGTGLTGTAANLTAGTATTAATASYANALNPANNYTVNSLTEGGYLAYPLREYVINLAALSDTNFYPVAIDNPPGTDATWHNEFSVDMVNQSGGATYNMHSMYGEVRGQGWTDETQFYRVFHTYYAPAERSILGIWRGTQTFYGVVVYLRGGKNYYVRTTSRSVVGYSSAQTLGSAVFAIKNAAGADVSGTSANIGEMLNLINNPAGFYHNDNVYVGTSTVLHLGTTSAPNLSIGGSAASAATAATATSASFATTSGNTTGNAGSVTNGVYTTGSQSIAGNKTFTGTTIVTGSIETAAVRETFSAVSSTTTVSIDLSTATVFNLTFTSTISAFNITNVNTNRVNSFTLITAPNGTGATIAWSFQTNGGGAANVKWASNVSPTATTTNGRFDIFSFVYNGTNWYGFTGGQNYV